MLQVEVVAYHQLVEIVHDVCQEGHGLLLELMLLLAVPIRELFQELMLLLTYSWDPFV